MSGGKGSIAVVLLLCLSLSLADDHSNHHDQNHHNHHHGQNHDNDHHGGNDDIVMLNMGEYCGRTFNMAERNMDEMELRLGHFSRSCDCHMTIVTSFESQLMVDIQRVSLSSSRDWVGLYDEQNNRISANHHSGDVSVVTTYSNTVVVKFHSAGDNTYSDLEILITSFLAADPFTYDCAPGHFKCEIGFQCIKSHLKCNTRDNCFDKSDEHGSLSNCGHRKLFLALAIGGALIVVAVIATVIVYRCFRKKQVAKRIRVNPVTNIEPIKKDMSAWPEVKKDLPELSAWPQVKNGIPELSVSPPPVYALYDVTSGKPQPPPYTSTEKY